MMDSTECQSSDICVYTCDGHGKWSVEFKPHTVNTEKHKPAQRTLVHRRLELRSKKVQVLR